MAEALVYREAFLNKEGPVPSMDAFLGEEHSGSSWKAFLYNGPEIDIVPQESRRNFQRVLARATRQQSLAATAFSRLGVYAGYREAEVRKRLGEVYTSALNDIRPPEEGSWGDLVDQLSGIRREGTGIVVMPLTATAE
jgi:hypothetical protein